ncbi:LOW QUALITY PROTEIN: hypothetical protein PHMEG_0005581 [Phytophthora megakarya]|uniref:Uncharacterized protein n=1 Tax=Phytophthora megakarya TaxID=4795 RepID=A0A225WSM0_9STRA|nr:LOW QUALITY PROTEIN: hypothetical protein PHMEG_0005581 [Phytophthora megakarya]
MTSRIDLLFKITYGTQWRQSTKETIVSQGGSASLNTYVLWLAMGYRSKQRWKKPILSKVDEASTLSQSIYAVKVNASYQ